MSDFVEIFEVGPRDGLQNESGVIAARDKIKLVNLLSECGFSHIETTSFVSPKWVPQMADAAEVMAGIARKPGISYSALTPNLQGYEAARQANVDAVAIFGSASEGFSQKNINCSIDESFARFSPILSAAKGDDIPVRGYVSCVTDCPYDGPTKPEAVARVAARMLDEGCYEISLGDTIGAGTPKSVARMLDAVLEVVPASKIAGHFHDTYGRATENIEMCLSYGIRVFDSAVGGLGGCPYAEGAKGNVDTVLVGQLLEQLGYETKLDFRRLKIASDFAKSLTGERDAV